MKGLHLTKNFESESQISFDLSQSIPMPIINSETECLVKVDTAGVNPSDVVGTLGYFAYATLPRTVGRDFSGTVVEGPDKYKGWEVWGSGGDIGLKVDGTHAEFIKIPIGAISRKPNALTLEEAGGIGVPYITAYDALVCRAHIKTNDNVVIMGANGQVGFAALNIAKWKGANVIAVTRQTGQHQKLDGVTYINYESGLKKQIAEFTGGKGADIILNPLGNLYFDEATSSLANEGRIITIAASPGKREVSLDLFENYRANISLIGVNTGKLDSIACAKLLDQMRDGFESKKLLPLNTSDKTTFSLEQAADAYKMVKEKSGGHKILIKITHH
jgi:NADPH2:quinone reductase